jgi:adenylate kinase
MLQAISAGRGEKYLPYIEDPKSVPSELVINDIVQRLKQRDCVERGWVLDGFPYRFRDTEYLTDQLVIPNRSYLLIQSHLVECSAESVYRSPPVSQIRSK